MVIGLLVTLPLVAQVADEIMDTVTTSPFFSVVVDQVEVLLPTLLPFTFQTYVGFEPPLTGVAVKLTDAPEQIDVVFELIDTAGSTAADARVIRLLVAVGFEAQG